MFVLADATTSRICRTSVLDTPPITNMINSGWSPGRGLLAARNNLSTHTELVS